MELFERITALYEVKNMTQAKFAEALGASPSKFNQWLNPKSQKNLWEHLPTILEMFPDVRREWLYFGEGEPFGNDSPASLGPEGIPAEDVTALQSKVAELEAELRQADRLNRQLVIRFLVDGVGDKDGAKNTADKAAGGQ